MPGRIMKLLNIAFLLILLSAAAGVSSFHTEGPAGNDPLCPACHFQNAAVAEAQLDLFQLPVLALSDILVLPCALAYEGSDSPVSDARAPPLV